VKDAKERRSKDGMLLGPRNASKWLEWRVARDKRLSNPRRLKTVKDNESARAVSE
jgi:hypothetical protein